jgi:hypothetical protein
MSDEGTNQGNQAGTGDTGTPQGDGTGDEGARGNQQGTGDTGNPRGDGTDAQGAQAKWHDTLPEEIRADERLTALASVEDLAKGYLELTGKARKAPEKPDAYTFAAPDGVTVDREFLDRARSDAHKAGMSDEQFSAMAGWYLKEQQALSERAAQEEEAGLNQLKKTWGNKFEANAELAKKTAKALLNDADLQWLDTSRMGNHPVLARLFQTIGEVIGEDSLAPGGRPRKPRSAEVPRTPGGEPMLHFKQ